MSAPLATAIVFLPGFDGAAAPRDAFVAALGASLPARAIGYPPARALETLSGYARFAAAQVGEAERPVLVAESFSGLVAARWASQDPHVAGVVLCGAFARSPMPWAALGAAMPAATRFLGANFLGMASLGSSDAARRRWSKELTAALRAMSLEVVAERLRIITAEDVSRELAGLRVPVVIAHFADDLVVGGAARAHLEAACHNAGRVRIPGPHFAIETRPRECAAALLPSLAALFPGSAMRTGTR